MTIKVILADDHQLFREGLANLLADFPEIEVIAQAVNGKDAIDKAKQLNPDVVIMDINMPDLDGVEATAQLLKEKPGIKVIGLSMHVDKPYIKGMLEAGSSGYLFKNCSYDELIKAIQTVYSGKKYLSEKITEILIQEYLNKEEIGPSTSSDLTDRESEILKLIAEGISVSDISNQLFVSIKTINTHKQHILEKLNLKTTTDIVKYALKKGIISLE
ncbi:MAG: response regulator transcription factor [Prolixibacteraceae bacterium]|jgi:DNA-binding NarL/FixJ family response regulator